MRASIIIALLFYTLPALASWTVSSRIDPITDKTITHIYVNSDTDEKFTLIKKSDNSVWGYFILSGLKSFLSHEILIFRVDKNKPKFILAPDTVGNASEWLSNRIGVKLWSGEANEIADCDYLSQLLNGSKLIIRYHPTNYTQRDVSFEISKGKNKIREGLSISASECK